MKNNTKQIILAYYAECCKAAEEAEKEYDNAKTAENRSIYYWCNAQVEAVAELMEKLDIDYEEEEV